MEVLRPAFEAWLTFDNIADDVAIVGGERFTPFQVLSMNHEAFRAKFLEWRDGEWLPERKRIAATVCADAENSDRLRQLIERMEQDGNVIPFVGAGLSIPSGFKLWGEFLHQLRAHCQPPLSEADLNTILASPNGYELAAETIMAGMPLRLLNERFEGYSRAATLANIQGCVRLLPVLCSRHGVTTNFDNVLELVYSGYEKPFDSVLQGRQITEWDACTFRGATVLLKIHGHATQPDTRVLTASEYDAAYAPGSPHRIAMENIVRISAFLFLGCSLGTDRTMGLIKEVFDTHPNLATRNYAFLPMPDDEPWRRTREAFLAERAIFPIWYGDYGESRQDGFNHDLYVESLLVELLDRQGKIGTLDVTPEEPYRIEKL